MNLIPPTPWPPIPPDALPDYDTIVTEDDTPVDNIFSEKQQRLLTEALYSSWPGPGAGQPFLALANVGLFYQLHTPPLVPDCLLSLFVRAAKEIREKKNRSYFIWEFGKTPEVVLEVVSNREGGEDSHKLQIYAQIGIPYYGIYDPEELLRGGAWRLYRLQGRSYEPYTSEWMPDVGLGLKLWTGEYEGMEAVWLRWCDQSGQVVLTGSERAEQEHQRAEQAERRAQQLMERLRAAGLEPPSE